MRKCNFLRTCIRGFFASRHTSSPEIDKDNTCQYQEGNHYAHNNTCNSTSAESRTRGRRCGQGRVPRRIRCSRCNGHDESAVRSPYCCVCCPRPKIRILYKPCKAGGILLQSPISGIDRGARSFDMKHRRMMSHPAEVYISRSSQQG